MDRIRFDVGGGNVAKSTDLRCGMDFRFPSSSDGFGLLYAIVAAVEIPILPQDP